MSYQQIALGDFRFSIGTALYNELEHTSNYNWTANERFQNRPATQATGLGEETINLNGVIFPEYKGGLKQIDKIREIAGQMQPLHMVSERGYNLGQWVIKSISSINTNFIGEAPLKMEFTLELSRYGEDAKNG